MWKKYELVAYMASIATSTPTNENRFPHRHAGSPAMHGITLAYVRQPVRAGCIHSLLSCTHAHKRLEPSPPPCRVSCDQCIGALPLTPFRLPGCEEMIWMGNTHKPFCKVSPLPHSWSTQCMAVLPTKCQCRVTMRACPHSA